MWRGFRTRADVNRVRSNARLQKKEEYSFAAFRWLLGEAMAGRYGTQGLLDFRNLGPRGGIRSVRKKLDIQLIGGAPICIGSLERQADFATVGRSRFRHGSKFSRDGVNFRWRGAGGLRLLTARRDPAQAEQKNESSKPGSICLRID